MRKSLKGFVLKSPPPKSVGQVSIYHLSDHRPEAPNIAVAATLTRGDFTMFLVSPLQNFLSNLNPSHIGINWEVYWWSSGDPQFVMPSPGPSLLPAPSPKRTPLQHSARTLSGHQIVNVDVWISTPFYWVFFSFLKYSVCLTPEAPGLKVWRWNSCSFDPFASFWLLCCVLYLLLKPSSVK